jgi:hypothetical protein
MPGSALLQLSPTALAQRAFRRAAHGHALQTELMTWPWRKETVALGSTFGHTTYVSRERARHL